LTVSGYPVTLTTGQQIPWGDQGNGAKQINHSAKGAPQSIVREVSAESLVTRKVKRGRRGPIVSTDKWRGYDPLMFCGYHPLTIDPSL
jgi:hypothetical protein